MSIIVVQIGQCGNQVGFEFFTTLAQELVSQSRVLQKTAAAETGKGEGKVEVSFTIEADQAFTVAAREKSGQHIKVKVAHKEHK